MAILHAVPYLDSHRQLEFPTDNWLLLEFMKSPSVGIKGYQTEGCC